MLRNKLAIEKTLKALVCRQTRDVPPRIHNLTRLSELAGVEPDNHAVNLLADMNQFNLEGRSPEPQTSPPSAQEAMDYEDAVTPIIEITRREGVQVMPDEDFRS